MKLIKDTKLLTIVTANIISSIGTGITSITVPWLLIGYPGGEVIYGYTFFGLTIAAFFLSPLIGSYIDQYSRKKCILFTESFGLSVICVAFCNP